MSTHIPPLRLAALPLLLALATLLSACSDSGLLPAELSGSPGNPAPTDPQAEEPPCVAI